MLKWVFGADTGPYRSALQSMRKETQAFSGSITKQLAGMFGGAALLGGAKALISHFARIKDLADRFGESSESIQRIGYAAEQAGTDVEGLAKGMTKATQNAVEAAQGGKEMAEAFARMGVDAGNFANLGIEDKMLALADSYDKSSNKAEALADIVKIVGKSGAEMIPMLAGGADALRDAMDGASIASDGVVNTLANMDDQLATLKNTLLAWGAWAIAWIQGTIGISGAIVMGIFETIGDGIRMLTGGFTALGDVISKTLAGDFDGASKSGDEFFRRMKHGMEEIERTRMKTKGIIDGTWNDTVGGVDSKNAGADQKKKIEDAKSAAEQLKKTEEDKARLTKDIAKLEEDARIRQLSLAEKILDAEKRRAELSAESLFLEDDTARLEAQKKMLETEKEIAGYRKEQSDADNTTEENRKKITEELTAALDAEDKANRDNKFAAADEAGRIAMLKEERDAALSASKNSEDPITQTEKRTEAAGKQGEIDALTRSMNDALQSSADELGKQAPTIATSSLADIGGGGGVNLMMSQTDILKQQLGYLAQIAANSANGSQGAQPPEPV